MKKKLEKREMISKSLNNISVIKWKDKRNVWMITNAFVPELVESFNRYGNLKQKLNAIHVYNQNISSINQSDQILSYHSGLRKTVRSYKKVGIYIFEIFVANSFYLSMKNTTRPKSSTKIKPEANFHYLCPIPATEKKKTPTRTWKHCLTKENRKKIKISVSEMPRSTSIVHRPMFPLAPRKDWQGSNRIIFRKWTGLRLSNQG